jgi:TolA-binding protein
MKHTLLALCTLALSVLAACSSQPVVPEAKNVKVSREDADSDCREIGRVQGSVKTSTGTIEQAIEDMKLDAARKGANYVRMESTGAMGTSASGTAYQCR